MSKLITGRNIFDRIKDATRAFRGKPARSIQLGIEVKKCSECGRGYCETCANDKEFKRLLSLPNCNDCKSSKTGYCGFRPKIGQDVRINCPLWEAEEENDGTR